jgi:3-deoxy-D-manno-octulosonic-acid transferase
MGSDAAGRMGGSARLAFGLYRVAGIAIRPVAPLLLGWRVRKGKEDPARLGERYGRTTVERPAGRLIWLHAASVGETIAVLPLIRKLRAEKLGVLLTTVTVTSAKIADDRLPPGAIHQYAPIDCRPWTEAFLDHWRPDLAIFVESEMWPQAIMSLAARSIPLVIANARMSDRSFNGWKRYRSVVEAMLSRVSLCLAQSARDGERFSALGAPRVVVTGNLKFDSPPLQASPEAVATLRAALGGRPVWMAASTHPGEDEIVADAHRLLAATHPGLLTVIVPRHPERGPDIAAALAGRGLKVARRKADEPLTPDVAIYVADTLGELGLFYRVVPLAFMGGSLVPHGGQNPIEPIGLGAAVLHGPHIHNFADVYAALDAAVPAAQPVADAAGLAAAASHLLTDEEHRARSVAEAQAVLRPFTGAMAATWTALGPYLGGTAANGPQLPAQAP